MLIAKTLKALVLDPFAGEHAIKPMVLHFLGWAWLSWAGLGPVLGIGLGSGWAWSSAGKVGAGLIEAELGWHPRPAKSAAAKE